MTLRIGIVGAGENTCLRHIPGFQKQNGVEVVAVCNRSRASSQKVADEFGIPVVHEDWKELVHNVDVDAVCIGTWPNMHCPVTLEALKADKHVLTEARMAMNLEEARQMHAASKKTDKVSMIVPAPIWLETEATILNMVSEGQFGDILDIQVCGFSGGYDPQAPLHWRQRKELSGNNIITMGILNETVHRYAGTESSVSAFGTVFTSERLDPETGSLGTADVPESIGIIAHMQGGATAVYHVSNVTHGASETSMAVYGTKGSFKLDDGAWVALSSDSGFRPLEVPASEQGRWRVEEEFVEAVTEGKPVTHTSFEDGVKYMEFTEAVNVSMQEGRKVELPLT